MKISNAFLCLLFPLINTANAANTPPIRAVINAQNSQIVEQIPTAQTPSLTVNQDSLLPLVPHFSAITQIRATNYKDWSAQLGKQVTVVNKHRDLSYGGTLINIENSNGSFALKTSNNVITLPSNDFYLVPLQTKTETKNSNAKYPDIVSYQSNDLSWSPKRTLIFTDESVTIINSATIHNAATTPISLTKSLLQYSARSNINVLARQNTMPVMQSKRSAADYTNNEITFPLNNLHLKANSDTLVELNASISAIDKKVNTSNVFTSLNNMNSVPLTFLNTLYFTLSDDTLPGQYQTFWRRDGLIIPSQNTNITSARAKQSIQVATNTSFDVTGQLSLISSTSQKLPTTQIWEVTISNHSNKTQSYLVNQNVAGIIHHVKGKNVSQNTASGLQIIGEVQGNKTQKYTYQIQLNK